MGKPLCQKSTPAGWVPITSETVFYSFKSARPRSIPASPVLINIASPLKSYSTHKRDIRGFHAFQKEEPIRLLSNFCWPVWTQPVSFVFRIWWLFPKPEYPGCGNLGRVKPPFETDRWNYPEGSFGSQYHPDASYYPRSYTRWPNHIWNIFDFACESPSQYLYLSGLPWQGRLCSTFGFLESVLFCS